MPENGSRLGMNWRFVISQGIALAGMLVIGVYAFAQAEDTAKNALKQAETNAAANAAQEAEIDAIKEDLGSIRTNQAIIVERQKHENQRNEEFRAETGRDLDRILRALSGDMDGGR